MRHSLTFIAIRCQQLQALFKLQKKKRGEREKITEERMMHYDQLGLSLCSAHDHLHKEKSSSPTTSNSSSSKRFSCLFAKVRDPQAAAASTSRRAQWWQGLASSLTISRQDCRIGTSQQQGTSRHKHAISARARRLVLSLEKIATELTSLISAELTSLISAELTSLISSNVDPILNSLYNLIKPLPPRHKSCTA